MKDLGQFIRATLRKYLNENETPPKSGESSGKPAVFKQNSKPIKTNLMNISQIVDNIDGIPYYKEVLDDVKNNGYSWGVTKKVKEYADYMIKNPTSLKNLPPIIVVDGKLQDGAHRISSIFLIKNLLDKDNDFWGKFKMNVQFWDSNDLDTVISVY